MPRGKPEQAEHIILKLREVEGEVGRGKTVAEAVKKIGVSLATKPRRSTEHLSVLSTQARWRRRHRPEINPRPGPS